MLAQRHAKGGLYMPVVTRWMCRRGIVHGSVPIVRWWGGA
jgi:hypothetical protein